MSKAMEALASECAILVSRTGDVEELDNGNAGVLVGPDDKWSTRRELFHTKKIAQRNPLQKRKSHVENFSIKKMVSATEDLYSSLQGPPLLQEEKRILGDFGYFIDKLATIFLIL